MGTLLQWRYLGWADNEEHAPRWSSHVRAPHHHCSAQTPQHNHNFQVSNLSLALRRLCRYYPTLTRALTRTQTIVLLTGGSARTSTQPEFCVDSRTLMGGTRAAPRPFRHSTSVTPPRPHPFGFGNTACHRIFMLTTVRNSDAVVRSARWHRRVPKRRLRN